MPWVRGRVVAASVLVLLLAATTGNAAPARLEFTVTDTTLVVPGLDPGLDGLRVAQISDAHLGVFTPDDRVRRAIAAVNEARPDLVFLTGDFVTFGRGPTKRVGQVFAGLIPPTFAVLGNHDHWVDAPRVTRELAEVGYTVLENAARRIEVRGRPLWIVGIGDLRTGHDDVDAALRDLPPGESRLVLAHGPRTVEKLPPGAGLVMFSGHTHGGQVVVGNLTPAIARRVGEPYLSGLHTVRGNQVYVNVGLGHGRGGPGVRVGTRPELAFFTLRAGPPAPPEASALLDPPAAVPTAEPAAVPAAAASRPRDP